MKIEVNIRKKYSFLILGLVLLLIGVIAVVAYNPGDTPPANPAVFGHTANEVEVNVSGTITTLQQAIGNGGLNVGAVTPWFGPLVNSQVLNITHNLNSKALIISVYAAEDGNGKNPVRVNSDASGNSQYGVGVAINDSNNIQVRTANDGYRLFNIAGSASWSGKYMKVAIIKVSGGAITVVPDVTPATQLSTGGDTCGGCSTLSGGRLFCTQCP